MTIHVKDIYFAEIKNNVEKCRRKYSIGLMLMI